MGGQGANSNASSIKEHIIPGVSRMVEVTFTSEGKDLKNYKSFELKQSTKTHHKFTLILSHDGLDGVENYHMEEAKELLGKSLLVCFRYKGIKDNPERYFQGVITKVNFRQDHGSRGYIIIKGYSPTILLDKALHIQSFGGDAPMPLSAVVDNILNQGYSDKGKYKSTIKVSKTGNLSYICQYNETHYNFLARTAEAYGEQFFYDGETLHFGDLPRGEKPIKLVYGRDVDNVIEKTKIVHLNKVLYGYNSLNNEKLSASSDTKLALKGTLAKAVYAKSEQLFKEAVVQQASIKASTNQDIQQVQSGMTGSKGMEVFVTEGTTTVPFLYPGCIVELDMLDPVTKTVSHFTTLMIVDIHHSVDALGKYIGKFKAVDAQTGYTPAVRYTVPQVELQIATVVSNNDTQGKGRVQVRFDWQDGSQSTEWIRVASTHAGGSDKVNTNRGLVTIPEVGDQVLVGFIGNNPDRPFVLASLFHGGNGAGGGPNNRYKVFTSRTGCSIIIDDDDNMGSVRVKDPSGNYWYMDGAGNINLTAPKDMTFTVGENLTINVGKDMRTTVGMNKFDTITMNSTESIGLVKTSSVLGNSNVFVTGKLTEIIKGDVESEVQKGKTETNIEGGLDNKVNGELSKSIVGKTKLNSGEYSGS